jgi:predicted Zn-dependent protease
MRLSPLDPLGYRFKAGIAFAHTVAKRYDEALDWVDQVLQEQPRHTVMVRLKASLLGHLERMEEAEEWIQRTLELYPGLTVAYLERYLNPLIAATPLQLEGLRKAGLPNN